MKVSYYNITVNIIHSVIHVKYINMILLGRAEVQQEIERYSLIIYNQYQLSSVYLTFFNKSICVKGFDIKFKPFSAISLT